jgi:hypothetical protein
MRTHCRANVSPCIPVYTRIYTTPHLHLEARLGADQQPGSPRGDHHRQIFNLPAELLLDLDAFCEAHYGAPRVNIVKEALTEFIGLQLQAEPELKRRFAEARARLSRHGSAIQLLDAQEKASSQSE